jgi:hypothetical protein
MNSKLEIIFRKEAKRLIESEINLPHVWDSCKMESKCCLRFPKVRSEGFEVEVHVDGDEITVFGEGSHIHFDNVEDELLTVQRALGLVRDMLSKNIRIIEYRAGDKPYKWKLQFYNGKSWQTVDIIGLFLFNIFSKRSQRILQNNSMPKRDLSTIRNNGG